MDNFRKNKKILIVSLAATTVIALAAGFFYFQKPMPASASWWNESWQYRQAITITKTVAVESNVYIALTLNTFTASTSMQADCGDFRFVTSDGREHPYYIVSGCRTASNAIHVQYDSLPLGQQTLYFYYGNPSASNGFSATDFSTAATNYTIGNIQPAETGLGPVGYWSFNSGYGSVAQDDSGQGNNGAITGAAWQDQSMCVSGKCLFFDGDGDNVNIGDPDSLDFGANQDFTLGAWIRTATSGPNRVIFGNRGGAGYVGYGFRVYPEGKSELYIRDVDDGSHDEIYSDHDDINDNNWHYVNVVVSRDEDAVFYMDGKEIGSGDVSDHNLSLNNEFNLYLGALQDGSPSFLGYIDEVKIYPYARTADQVKQDYASGLAGMGSGKGASAAIGSRSDKWLTDGLVGHWKFNESATTSGAADSSGYGNDGIYKDSASTTEGRFGNGVKLDGNNDYIDAGNDPSLDINNAITVSSWVKFKGLDYTGSTGVLNTIASKGYPDNLASHYGWWFAYDNRNNNNYFNYTCFGNSQGGWGGGYNNFAGSAYNYTFGNDIWYHLAFTISGNEAMLFINGEQHGPSKIFYNLQLSDTSRNLLLGWDNGGEFHNGSLDEVRIYNRALSPDEVAKLYEWPPGPVAHWTFDEKQGNTAYDSAASTTWNGGNHGTLGTSTASRPAWTRGKFGGALQFDGTNDFVNMGRRDDLDLAGHMTVGAWIKIAQAPADQDTIIGRLYDWQLELTNAGVLEFRRWASYQGVGSSEAVPMNEWHYVAAAVAPDPENNCMLYIDGKKVGIGNIATPINDSGLDTMISGYVQSDIDYFNGLIDDVRIYNYARTQKQILEDMLGDRPALDAPALHLKFDEGQGGTAHDSSIYKNDGTLTPGAGGAITFNTKMWSLQGKFGKSLNGDGDDLLFIADDPSLLPQDGSWSISLWAKPENINQLGTLVQKYQNIDPFEQWIFGIGGDLNYSVPGKKIFGYYVEDADVTRRNSLSNEIVVDGNWHHYVMIADKSANKIRLYADTKELSVSTDDFGSWPTINNTDTLIIGGIEGQTDEIRIYPYALNAEEIKTLYNGGGILNVGGAATADNNGTAVTGQSAEYCVPGDTAQCDKPVAEWKMDEKSGTTTYDTSGNGHNGTLGEGSLEYQPGWTRGKHGGALEFDGTDDRVFVGAKDDLRIDSLGNQLTLSAWVYWGGHPANLARIAGFSGYFGDYAFWVKSNGQVLFEVDGEDGNAWYSNGTLSQNAWNYIAGSFEEDSAKVYINGQIDRSEVPAFFPPAEGTSDFRLGHIEDYHYKGKIDEVRVYNYARTPAQIAWEYNKGEPVAWWKFDECSGGTIHDEMNSNNGQLILGASGVTATGTCASSSNSFWYNGRAGKRNSAGSFDGADDWVKAADNDLLDTGPDYTLSIWVFNQANSKSYPTIFNRAGQATDNGYFWIYTEGENERDLRFQYANGDEYIAENFNSALAYNQWTNIIFAFTDFDKQLRCYINGIQFGGSRTLTGALTVDDGDLYIGTYNGNDANYPFKGLVDEVKIWNYSLTAEQVKTEFNGGSVRFE